MKKVTGLTKRITAMLLSGMLIIGPTSGSVLAADIQEDVVSETVVEDVESDVSVADQESEDAEAEDSDAEEDADQKIEADEFKNSNLEENVSQEEGKDNAEAKSLSKENVVIEEEENSVGKTQEPPLLDELDQEEALTEEKGKQTAPGNREDSTDIDIISDSNRKGVVSTYVLTKLATPKDLMVSGTTLSWSPVENADYYYISIGVVKNGSATSTSSSTRESSYDMQAVIRDLMSSAGYTDSSELTLYIEVSAETNNPDIYANSNRAKISVPLSETGLNISTTKLATPKDLMVSGTTLSWSLVKNADYYCISIGVGKNGSATSTSSSTWESSYDMQAVIRDLMSSAGYTDSSELTLYIEVSAETNNPDIYASSNRAKISVPLSETGLNISTTKLATPKNLSLNNTVLTWDSVDNADYYYVRIYVEKDGRSYTSSAADSYPDKEMVDVAEGVHYSVSSAGYTDLDGLIITFEVKARSNREEFADSNPAKLVKEDYNGTYNPQEITPTITLSKTTFTYDGTVQKPTVTVKDGNTVLKESQDYTVEYPLGMINVGTYRIKVTFIGNYSEVLIESFTIKKAPQTITAKAAASSIAVGKTTMITTIGAQGKVTYESSDTSIATVDVSTGLVTGKKAGTVTITATSAATSNYNAASKTVNIIVTNNTSMVTGWQKIGGKWYYMNSSGVKLTGWQKIGGKWYYMNSSGAMTTGWQKLGGKWYYMNSSGAMTTGWQKIGGKWYYMNSSGAMTTGWQQTGGKWYYMNGSGVMTTGWQQIGGKWYYMNSNGVMTTGWQKIGGKWYYMNSSGQMVTGTQVIGGKTYVFNSSGVWVK